MAKKQIVIKDDLVLCLSLIDKHDTLIVKEIKMNSFDKEEIYSSLKSQNNKFQQSIVKEILFKKNNKTVKRFVPQKPKTAKELWQLMSL